MAAGVPQQPVKKTLSKNLMEMKVMHPYIPQGVCEMFKFISTLCFIVFSSWKGKQKQTIVASSKKNDSVPSKNHIGCWMDKNKKIG